MAVGPPPPRQFADFNSEPITGYVNQAGGEYMSVEAISHIEDNLWSGGCLPNFKLPDDFVHVVSLYPWGKWRLGPNTHRIEIEMYDSHTQELDSGQLNEIANMVSGYMDEGKTLVHCQAGLNRSGLISALTLINRGRTPEEAIALLRERRSPLVLCNSTFESWLLYQDGRFDRGQD